MKQPLPLADRIFEAFADQLAGEDAFEFEGRVDDIHAFRDSARPNEWISGPTHARWRGVPVHDRFNIPKGCIRLLRARDASGEKTLVGVIDVFPADYRRRA